MKHLRSQISSSDKLINNQALISLWIAGFKGAVLSNSHRSLFLMRDDATCGTILSRCSNQTYYSAFPEGMCALHCLIPVWFLSQILTLKCNWGAISALMWAPSHSCLLSAEAHSFLFLFVSGKTCHGIIYIMRLYSNSDPGAAPAAAHYCYVVTVISRFLTFQAISLQLCEEKEHIARGFSPLCSSSLLLNY